MVLHKCCAITLGFAFKSSNQISLTSIGKGLYQKARQKDINRGKEVENECET